MASRKEWVAAIIGCIGFVNGASAAPRGDTDKVVSGALRGRGDTTKADAFTYPEYVSSGDLLYGQTEPGSEILSKIQHKIYEVADLFGINPDVVGWFGEESGIGVDLPEVGIVIDGMLTDSFGIDGVSENPDFSITIPFGESELTLTGAQAIRFSLLQGLAAVGFRGARSAEEFHEFASNTDKVTFFGHNPTTKQKEQFTYDRENPVLILFTMGSHSYSNSGAPDGWISNQLGRYNYYVEPDGALVMVVSLHQGDATNTYNTQSSRTDLGDSDEAREATLRLMHGIALDLGFAQFGRNTSDSRQALDLTQVFDNVMDTKYNPNKPAEQFDFGRFFPFGLYAGFERERSPIDIHTYTDNRSH